MNVLWLQSGGCGGCTLSWLGSELGPLVRTLADEKIEMLLHPSLSQATGPVALEILEGCAGGGLQLDVLCLVAHWASTGSAALPFSIWSSRNCAFFVRGFRGFL